MSIGENSNIIAKGEYIHPQVKGYLTVKNFMFVRREGKRCVLLRFENEANFRIESFAFTLIQLDAYGKRLGKIKLFYDDVDVPSARTFSPERGIVVNEKCVDFYVQMSYVISGYYKYAFKNGEVSPCYDPLGYERKRYDGAHRLKQKVKARFFAKNKFHRTVAVLAVLLVVCAVALGALAAQSKFGKFKSASSVTQSSEASD